MEVEQVHLDLLDLRQLYCLMQNYCPGQQNRHVQALSARARYLFKSLLDDATEKVFMAYSKIVETQNLSDQLCSSLPEKTKNAIPNPKLIFEARKSTPQMAATAADSGLSSKPQRRKQCRACARGGTAKPGISVEINSEQTGGSKDDKNGQESDWLRNYEMEKKSRFMGNEKSASLNSFVSCPSSTSHGTDLYRHREKKTQDEAVDFSEGISNTIKRIESHILALKCRSRSRNHVIHSDLGRTSRATESSPVGSDILSNWMGELSKNKSPIEGLSLRNEFGRSEHVGRASQLDSNQQVVKRKAILGRMESLSQSVNRPSPSPEFVHGFVVPSVSEDTGLKELTRKTTGSDPPRPPGSDAALGRSRAKEEPRKNVQRQMLIRPTLLDHPTTELMVLPSSVKDRTARVVTRKMMTLPREEEDSQSQSSSSASYSPSWTSHQSGASSSDSSEYSMPRPHAGFTKRIKPDSHKGSEKVIGRLRRLKNKLGLILHHHHHHHHDGDDRQLRRVNHSHSLWKHVGNLFHSAQKKRPVKKNSKSTVKKGARKDQAGHFHALAEGLMRHVWKSSKSKPSKGKIRGLGSNQRRQKKKKKTVRKLQWWKLPNKAKGGVRVGFGNRKRRLKLM